MDGRRRAFLRGAFLTSAGRAEENKRQQPLGPVPPWHQGQPLAEHCLDCAQPCVEACEPDIIRIHPESYEFAGIPYLDFSANGCTFCQACVEACPIELDISGPRPVIGEVQLNRTSCIAWNEIICMSCSDRCEYSAITTTNMRQPQVNADNCTGCGMCVSACPVNALQIA